MYASKQGTALPQFAYKTDVKINFFIKTLDANKVYDWDKTSIKMIQVCGDFVAFPLMSVFETTIKEQEFPAKKRKCSSCS